MRTLIATAVLLIPSLAFGDDSHAALALAKARREATPACVCPDSCSCPPGVCPGGCPVASVDPNLAVVYVYSDIGGGATAAGTGTVIGSEDKRNLVLTNAHVVKGRSPNVAIARPDGTAHSYPATVLATAGDGGVYPDLALLVIDAELPAVDIAETMPAPGSPLTMYGYGPARTWEPSKRTGVTLPHGSYTDPWLVSNLYQIPGDSGCGVFDSTGRLVGCNSLAGGGTLGANVTSIHTFTVTTLDKRPGLFQRLKNRLAARKISNVVRGYLHPDVAPVPASPAPKGPKAAGPVGYHLEKQCLGNGRCQLVWVKD